MAEFQSELDKNQFLSEGALWGFGDSVLLMWDLQKSDSNEPGQLGVVLVDFFLESPFEWRSYGSYWRGSKAEALNLFQTSSVNYEWEEARFESFARQFEWIQKEIGSGKLSKAVPYVFEKSKNSVPPENLESLIGHGLKHSQSILYGTWNVQGGILGMSPERLFVEEDHHSFSTMALAGTKTLEEHRKNPHLFLEDPKERHEHELVALDIEEKLKSFSYERGPLEVFETPHLAHLKTPFQFFTEGSSFEDLVKQLHPTPALGASPRDRVWEVMKHLQSIEERKYFGAPIGLIDEKSRKDCVVAIRNIIWNQSDIFLGSGCGVVNDSQLEKEWNELKAKRGSVKRIFGL
ncbi:MAG: chorismate-binding protein [Pseudomonadota bacterium]